MNPNREEPLFQLAPRRPGADRPAWLDAECKGDPAMRQRLEMLLAAHEQPKTLLATQAETDRLREDTSVPGQTPFQHAYLCVAEGTVYPMTSLKRRGEVRRIRPDPSNVPNS